MDGAVAGAACPICFRPFAGLKQSTTPCGHTFCSACLIEATARTAQGRACPMCRTPFPSGYMDVPTDEITSYLLKVRSRRAQNAVRHSARFAYGNTVLPLPKGGGSRWCVFLRLEAPAGAGAGLSEADYIERVRDFATAERFTYAHRWEQGDLTIWVRCKRCPSLCKCRPG